jgi:hypothetical protein
MPEISREMLASYLEDALNTSETAQVEQALRSSPPLRAQLRVLMQEQDRGEHSIGAIWRRERLTCPTREQLGSYLLQALEADLQEYLEFHLKTIGCPFCQANLADLQSRHKQNDKETQKRRRRIFQSSAGLVQASKETK